ncbi:MAG: hypothetical protein V8S03_10580 [Faecalimonas umbilicata]|uniref:hypothetical protein n=1 Tax=Faecalimonas umbilicata TaxID=1912855 RepID=UPI00300F74CA
MRKERKIINTNIRLNLMDEQDKKAWEYLQTMDREKYKSYTRVVVIVLNDYFDREYRREADPYLETREKEDAFLEKVVDAVKEGAEESMPMVLAKNLLEALRPMMERRHRVKVLKKNARLQKFLMEWMVIWIPEPVKSRNRKKLWTQHWILLTAFKAILTESV